MIRSITGASLVLGLTFGAAQGCTKNKQEAQKEATKNIRDAQDDVRDEQKDVIEEQKDVQKAQDEVQKEQIDGATKVDQAPAQ